MEGKKHEMTKREEQDIQYSRIGVRDEKSENSYQSKKSAF